MEVPNIKDHYNGDGTIWHRRFLAMTRLGARRFGGDL
jgi:hypothetical protein